LLAVAALVSCLSGPAAAEPWWPFNSSDQQAYDAAYQALKADPGDPGRLAAFANIASRIGNYEAAIGALEAILIQNPGLNRVRVELGVMYYRVGAHEVSRFHLERALASGTLDEKATRRAQSFLEADAERLDGTSISGYLSGGVRYDTNPGLLPDADLIFGFDQDVGQFLAPPTADPEGGGSTFLQGYLLWREDLGTQYNETWDTAVLGYWRFQFSDDNADIGYQKITTGPRLAVLPDSTDNFFVRPYVIATLSFLEYDYSNITGGGGATLSKRFGTWLTGYADANVRYRSAESDDYSGLLVESKVGVTMALTEDLLLGLGGRFLLTDAEADFRSSTVWGIFGSINYRYDAPFELTDYPWELTLRGEVLWEDFDGVNPILGPGLERDDTDSRIVIRNTVGLSSAWFLYAEGGLQWIGSSVPNYEANNSYVALGATWRF